MWGDRDLTGSRVSCRGGRIGLVHEVLLSSCPAEIQRAYVERFGHAEPASLPVPIEAAGAPLPFIPSNPEKEARDDKRATWLESLIRSEEHTSELQSLMRISYAVFCLKKKKNP